MRPLPITLPMAAMLSLCALQCGAGGSSALSSAPTDAGYERDGASLPDRFAGDGPTQLDASSGSDAGRADGAPGGDSGADSWSAPEVGTPVEAGSPGAVDITFEVYPTQDLRPISPYVYGVNDVSQAAAVHSPIGRLGGNRLTAYNWENNASNAGQDYQFENDDFLCSNAHCLPTNDAPGAFLKATVDTATAAGAAMVITVPMVDYVSADKSPPGDVRNSGMNYLQTRFKQNVAAKGAAFQYPPDTTDAYVYQDEMVSWLTGQAERNATLLFQLDNEPDLWASTHAEVHPMPVTYAELAQRDVEYATAIKAVAPAAYVVGPVNYGWAGYTTLQMAPDSQAHGDFLDWWLDQMKAAEQTAGKRLIDMMDLHWYPEATGGGARITDDGTAAPEVAAREQAPRSLWDTGYTETSWIAQSSTNGPIYLILRMLQKIAQHYPGTGLSISEWNYGGGTDISGAVATADVLGIFGAYGVKMAMLWPLNGNESFTYAAFEAYRNYDGKGAAFGDTSVKATSTDIANGTVYGSIQASDASRLVVLAINKALASKKAGIVLHHSTVYTKADVYTIAAATGAAVVPAGSLSAVATNAFDYPMPAQSVSVIVPVP